MIEQSEQRRVERLTVPRHCRGAGGGRNTCDVTTFHHINGIHDQRRSGPGHLPRFSSGFSLS